MEDDSGVRGHGQLQDDMKWHQSHIIAESLIELSKRRKEAKSPISSTLGGSGGIVMLSSGAPLTVTYFCFGLATMKSCIGISSWPLRKRVIASRSKTVADEMIPVGHTDPYRMR